MTQEILPQLAMTIGNFPKCIVHTYTKDSKGRYIECNEQQAKSAGLNNSTEIKGITDFDIHTMSKTEASGLRNNDLIILKKCESRIFIEPVTFTKKIIAISYKTPLLSSTNNKILAIKGVSIIVDPENLIISALPIHPYLKSRTQNSHYSNLTIRESECLYYYILGKSAKQIAKRLFISPRTVESHLYKCREKLDCHDRSTLIEKGQ